MTRRWRTDYDVSLVKKCLLIAETFVLEGRCVKRGERAESSAWDRAISSGARWLGRNAGCVNYAFGEGGGEN